MISTKTNQWLLLPVLTLILASCSKEDKRTSAFSLEGVWTLMKVEYPMGNVETYPRSGYTLLRIYAGGNTLYQCRLMQTESALVVRPYEKYSVKMIDQGGGERLYLEDNDPHPLTVLNESTIVIQHSGILSTWHLDTQLTSEWGMEIRDIAVAALKKSSDETGYYILSAKERVQASAIHWLVYAVIAFIIVVVVITMIAVSSQRAKQHLQWQLKQIQEEHDACPPSVKNAIQTEESAFFTGDDYQALQRRIATGECLKEEGWNMVETQLKRVYPGFTSQLRTLYPMSELEYQTCLLIKLRIAPSDIAAVLARDVSTISTVRSRLYKKVFGQKGGARAWDDFILSIGA